MLALWSLFGLAAQTTTILNSRAHEAQVPAHDPGKLAPGAAASVNAIWAVNDGEKIERDDLRNPNKASNSVWDGQRVKIFGARNEIIAFQLIVEAGSAGIQNLSVTLPELKLRGAHAKIVYAPPAHDPTQYTGKPIQIFSENYMLVRKPTEASWIYKPGTPSAPSDPTGWKPVQLVPENARSGKGGFPLKVEPLQNQAIWIEVYTARNLPAGIYDGDVRVTADGQVKSVPIELELFNFTLPDENSMHAMVYYESRQAELYQGIVSSLTGGGGTRPAAMKARPTAVVAIA